MKAVWLCCDGVALRRVTIGSQRLQTLSASLSEHPQQAYAAWGSYFSVLSSRLRSDTQLPEGRAFQHA